MEVSMSIEERKKFVGVKYVSFFRSWVRGVAQAMDKSKLNGHVVALGFGDNVKKMLNSWIEPQFVDGPSKLSYKVGDMKLPECGNPDYERTISTLVVNMTDWLTKNVVKCKDTTKVSRTITVGQRLVKKTKEKSSPKKKDSSKKEEKSKDSDSKNETKDSLLSPRRSAYSYADEMKMDELTEEKPKAVQKKMKTVKPDTQESVCPKVDLVRLTGKDGHHELKGDHVRIVFKLEPGICLVSDFVDDGTALRLESHEDEKYQVIVHVGHSMVLTKKGKAYYVLVLSNMGKLDLVKV
jgi:hypothetical protein